jgi:hypothetical protein
LKFYYLRRSEYKNRTTIDKFERTYEKYIQEHRIYQYQIRIKTGLTDRMKKK